MRRRRRETQGRSGLGKDLHSRPAPSTTRLGHGFSCRNTIIFRCRGPLPDDSVRSLALPMCSATMPLRIARQTCVWRSERRVRGRRVSRLVTCDWLGNTSPCDGCLASARKRNASREDSFQHGENRIFARAIDEGVNQVDRSGWFEVGGTESGLQGSRIRSTEWSLFPIDSQKEE